MARADSKLLGAVLWALSAALLPQLVTPGVAVAGQVSVSAPRAAAIQSTGAPVQPVRISPAELMASYGDDAESTLHQTTPIQLWETHGTGGPTPSGVIEASMPADCYYVDPWDNVWTGPCATQRDIDDGLAALAALDYEMDLIVSEVKEVTPNFCYAIGGYENYLQYPEETDEPCMFFESATEGDAPNGPHVGSHQTGNVLLALTLASHDDVDQLVLRPCYMEAAQTAAAVAGYVATKYAAYAVMVAKTPTTAAVSFAVLGAATGGFALAGAASSWIQCAREQSQ